MNSFSICVQNMTKGLGRISNGNISLCQNSRIRSRSLSTFNMNSYLRSGTCNLQSDRGMTSSIQVYSNSETTFFGLTLRRQSRASITTRGISRSCDCRFYTNSYFQYVIYACVYLAFIIIGYVRNVLSISTGS